ncbi:MAG: MiaB/RimO family radical SAM methylthiotransferase [Phycisphaerales bacterium]|nr:MiaB/RimO family radical SAM methylthiotransferase [Phycisphaerales bacterium]
MSTLDLPSMLPVYLETFGCQMNELDSELVQGQLGALGYTFVDRVEDATVILFNTCSVREQAEQKAYSRIGIVGARKRAGEELILGVIGCMAERDGLDLFRRHPQVDLMCGPGELDRLPQLIDNVRRTQVAQRYELTEPLALADRTALAGNKSRRSTTLAAAQDNLESLDLSRAFDPVSRGTTRHSAYVRITRGCNKFCTYCVVPNTRGAEIHRPPNHIVDECKRLVDAGVVEITLLGQTVNHYRYQHGSAITIDGREAPQVGPGLSAFRTAAKTGARITTFADLLRRIHEEVPALKRLRFLTSYPRDFGDDILSVMRDSPRICRYLHVPAQSGSDRILRLMNRGYTVGEYLEFVERAMNMLPGLCIAGDFIVGFPTETDDDFEASCALVRRIPFKNNFIFKYSPRPGTMAFDRIRDDVPDAVKRVRNNQLLALQTDVSRRVHESFVATRVEVLFDEVRVNRIARESGPLSQMTVLGRNISQSPSAQTIDRDQNVQCVGRTAGDIIFALPCDSEASAAVLVGKTAFVDVLNATPLLLCGALSASPAAETPQFHGFFNHKI